MITYEEKELLKDDVLKYLLTTNGVYSSQIAEKLKQKIELIDYLIYQLKLDGYVYTHPVQEHIIYIHDRGRFFLNIDGGHSSRYEQRKNTNKSIRLSKMVSTASTIAIVAIMIIDIGFQVYTLFKQDKIDKLENEILVLKRENLVLTNSKSNSTKK